MSVLHRSLARSLRRLQGVGGAAALGLTAIVLPGAISVGQATAATTNATSTATTTTGTPRYTAISDSLSPTASPISGAYSAAKMTVDVSLAPRDPAGLSRELQAVYTEGSGQYHRFLAKGQFDARYAPSAGSVSGVENYLRDQGLSVSATDSPFLLAATGSSARIEAAFRTTLSKYVANKGVHYFANSKPVYLPTSIADNVQGVVGLTNTVRPQRLLSRAPHETVVKESAVASGKSGSAASCESGYPTTQQLFKLIVAGADLAFGYGGGPGCTGLTPSQTNSVYGAPAPGPRTQGAGVTTAVFEMSAYQVADIETWAHNFYGANYHPDLTQVNVDGGPLSTYCPPGDTCEADYSGDIEVDADVEQELAVAPDAHIYVYDSPSDLTGQLFLDDYTAIANQDIADTVSTSWGECESDFGEAFAESENTIFEQMALQGQSMFAAAGDNGAYACLQLGTGTGLSVGDPGEPWLTSVGGTSLGTDNPGMNAHPGQPGRGVETVWNPDNLCSNAAKSPANDNQGGEFWCSDGGVGSGAGGSSEFWPAPFYQKGPGVISKYTTYGPKSCALATSQYTPCREVPDVSANSDEFTGYAEYCTGDASTVNSSCATIDGGGGWFAIGGTSLSAPLWGALIADSDSFHGDQRIGNINPLVYGSLSSGLYTRYFTDIAKPARSTESGVVPATSNGYYPTRRGYDEATGAGSPKFAAIITGF